MRIRLKMFSVLRERSGAGEAELVLGDGATVGAAIEEVVRRFPAAGDLVEGAAVAVNFDYVRRDVVLRDGDELALIPPVSGG